MFIKNRTKKFPGKHGAGEGEGGGRVEGEHCGEQRGVGGQHRDEEEADTEQYKGIWATKPKWRQIIFRWGFPYLGRRSGKQSFLSAS